MRRSPYVLTAGSLVLAAVLLAPAAVRAQAPTSASASAAPAAPVGPDVGQAAPDFTLSWADAAGARSAPVTLSQLRGKVVVVAFYPKDRTSGCTAELNTFRDDYTKLFGAKAGTDVIVLPISADDLDTHAAWVQESKFPFALAADPGLETAAKYGSRRNGMPFASRTVFVVGRDGRVAYRDLRFNALSQDAYAALGSAVAAAAKAGG